MQTRVRSLALATALMAGLATGLVLPGPVMAEDAAPPADAPPGPADEGLSLMQRGAQMLLRSLLDEIGPRMDDMATSLDQAMRMMGPALTDLVGKIDDIRNYEPPEIMPNGDIIIRRKPSAGKIVPKDGPQIDL